MIMNKAVGITGHREFGGDANTEWAWRELEAALKRAQENDYITLRTGMAPNTDIIAGELAHGIGMNVFAVIPYPGFADGPVFNPSWRNRYYLLLEKITGFVYVEGEEYAEKARNHDSVHYTAGKGYHTGAAYKLRDRILVNGCRSLIAVYDGREKGGTYYTFNYALTKKSNPIPVYLIDPVNETARWVRPGEV